MNEIVYGADWNVVYPVSGDVPEITRALRGRLMCNWSWDLFLWDLKELRRLLTKCPAEYNYLYLTRFLMARSTYLVLNGPFEFHAADMVTRLAQQHVQYAGIYRHLFLCELERAKFVRHPVDDDRQDERFFQLAITSMEDTFRQLLQVIVCVDDPHEEILGHPASEWIAGQLREKDGTVIDLVPPAVPMHVQSDEMRPYRKIKPAKSELVRKLLKKETTFTIRERHGRETACDMELERLCTWNAVKGHPVVRYGDDSFQYFAATVNESRNTIYVVCADRTLQMVNSSADLPGTVIREIHASWLGENKSVYDVSFDNGAHGACALSFRPHQESEKRQVPASVTRQVNRRGLDMTRCEGAKVAAEKESPITNSQAPKKAERKTEDGKLALKSGGRKARLGEKMTPVTKMTRETNGMLKLLHVEVIGDYAALRLRGGTEIRLVGKTKCRAFIRHIHLQRLKTGRREFLYQDEVEKLNASQKAVIIQSGDFKFGICRTIMQHFDVLFETLDRPLGRYRINF